MFLELISSRFVYTPVSSLKGFDPRWDEAFGFSLMAPELALLRFVVMDKDILTADDYIGQATIPFTSLMPGTASDQFMDYTDDFL